MSDSDAGATLGSRLLNFGGRATKLLADGIGKRKYLRWCQLWSWPAESVPVNAVGRASACFHTAATHFEDKPALRRSWWNQAMAHCNAPLPFRYTGPGVAARYAVCAVYGSGPTRLDANAGVGFHAPVNRPYQPLEVPVPSAATSGGSVELR
jgi:hypothetical protein